ncbi:MAG: aminotransferase class V-fold PLP-dependent enzyme, partial [Sinomicrobium sp.]|nr:aminotransferase class V-fold PLP-dependent enzyme [Sinomicrobium sp.]
MDIEQLRNDTPNCKDKLFMDSAGASLMPAAVVRETNAYLSEEEKEGGYKLAALRAGAIEDFYTEVAALLNCKPRNIAFAGSATEAYIKALSSVPFKPGDVIITTDDDYVSNHLHFIALRERFGVKSIRIKNLDNGDMDMENAGTLIKKHRPALVAVTHIPTNSGLIQDVEKIGALCETYNIPYLLDACQSVGQLEVDVKKIRCDFLSATGRKFLRGPRGTGFLFVSDKILQQGYTPLFPDLRGAVWTAEDRYTILDSARRFETWELPYALLAGFREALRYANTIGMKNIRHYNQQIMKRFRENLNAIPGVRMFDNGTHTANILTFRKTGSSLEAIKNALDKHRVYYSV